MKKIAALFLTGILLLTLAACGNQPENVQGEESDGGEIVTGDNKILVAYFSSAGNIVTDEEIRGNIGKGNTAYLAEMIQEQVDGDLFFIETVDKYPANYSDAINVAMQELRNDTRPALASHVEDMDEYDVIFLGYPNWWGTFPQAILTFLEEYDFSDKTVIPFCTYEDSGIGSSIRDMEKALPNTTILKEFAVAEKNLKDSEEAVKQWISELDI